MSKILIIAEAGVNHNGSLETACRMIDAAKDFGADVIKFQTGVPELVMSAYAPKAEYQKKSTGGDGSQLDMARKISLPLSDFRLLRDYCEKRGVRFLSTPFDLPSIDLLAELGMEFWKIPSGEITNYPYLVRIARTHKPIVLSTGMCIPEEIAAALAVLRENGCGGVTLLHCTTEYPAPFEDVNLNAMLTLKREFGTPVGYSDHTRGIEVPVAAAALGAEVIEKHFTLDRNMEGPDHKASLEPDEFAQMVSAVRHVELALGDGVKRVAPSERKNLAIARKSIVAKRDIQAGEAFTEENLTTKRPGGGVNPMRWNEVLGCPAKRLFHADELIEL